MAEQYNYAAAGGSDPFGQPQPVDPYGQQQAQAYDYSYGQPAGDPNGPGGYGEGGGYAGGPPPEEKPSPPPRHKLASPVAGIGVMLILILLMVIVPMIVLIALYGNGGNYV